MRVWAKRSELIDGRLPFIVTITLIILAAAFTSDAQQPTKVPRIGCLTIESPSAFSTRAEAFRQGLRELGYAEGKNIVIEWRSADGKLDRMSVLAAELAALNVNVIVTAGPWTPARPRKPPLRFRLS